MNFNASKIFNSLFFFFSQILTMSNKKRSTMQINIFILWLESYNFLNKNIIKHSSSNLEKQSSRNEFNSVKKNENKITAFKKIKIKQEVRIFFQVIYHKFMNLNQTESVIMKYDNIRNCNLVIIKRLKDMNKSLTCKIWLFTSNHVINIRDVYFDNDDIIIFYEEMNITLQNFISILQNFFTSFQIAAICKKISHSQSF